MTFKVGDKVVYPHHGAATIEKKERVEAFGEKRDYLILKLAYGELTLKVPAEKAADIKVIDYRMVGATGRVYLAGEEANVRAAGDAAVAALEAIQ